jgi:hypothetical protein
MLILAKGGWSGGQDLNLRHSGICALGRLSGTHLGQASTASPPVKAMWLHWLGSSTKLSYRPTAVYKNRIYDLCLSFMPLAFVNKLFDLPVFVRAIPKYWSCLRAY